MNSENTPFVCVIVGFYALAAWRMSYALQDFLINKLVNSFQLNLKGSLTWCDAYFQGWTMETLRNPRQLLKKMLMRKMVVQVSILSLYTVFAVPLIRPGEELMIEFRPLMWMFALQLAFCITTYFCHLARLSKYHELAEAKWHYDNIRALFLDISNKEQEWAAKLLEKISQEDDDEDDDNWWKN